MFPIPVAALAQFVDWHGGTKHKEYTVPKAEACCSSKLCLPCPAPAGPRPAGDDGFSLGRAVGFCSLAWLPAERVDACDFG